MFEIPGDSQKVNCPKDKRSHPGVRQCAHWLGMTWFIDTLISLWKFLFTSNIRDSKIEPERGSVSEGVFSMTLYERIYNPMEIKNAGNRVMNTWLYSIQDGWVMIDTGYENSYASVLKKLRKMQIMPENIRYLFLTHAHDDHAGFLEEWMTKHPHTQVIAHEKAIDGLRKGQNGFDGGCSTRGKDYYHQGPHCLPLEARMSR